MAEQAVTKSVDEAIICGVKSHVIRTIAAGAEQKVVSPPVSGDFKGGTSVVIPATQTLASTTAVERVATCPITDDEGNVFADAFEFIEWSSGTPANGTVDANGWITGIQAGDTVVTASVLGVTDTITVTVPA